LDVDLIKAIFILIGGSLLIYFKFLWERHNYRYDSNVPKLTKIKYQRDLELSILKLLESDFTQGPFINIYHNKNSFPITVDSNGVLLLFSSNGNSDIQNYLTKIGFSKSSPETDNLLPKQYSNSNVNECYANIGNNEVSVSKFIIDIHKELYGLEYVSELKIEQELVNAF
jgi:hypothetical protein